MNDSYLAAYFKNNLSMNRSTSPEPFASFCYDGTPVSLRQSGEVQKEFSIKEGDLEFKVVMNCYPEFHAAEWLTTVTNTSDKPSGILSDLRVMDLQIPVPSNVKIVHKGINGDHCSEESYLPFLNSVNIGDSIFMRPQGGKSSRISFPFFDICGENEGLICGIGWTGNWCYEIWRDDEKLILKAGLPSARFYMNPGETLRLPRVLILAYEGENVVAHNRFRKLIKEHYSPKKRFGDEMKMPIDLMNYDRYANPFLPETMLREFGYKTEIIPEWSTEAGQLQEIDYTEKCEHCDTYWLDAAWFEAEFPYGVGNYYFKDGYPDGLTNITRYAHEKGLRAMIWFEPERVYHGTQLDKEHPEFLLKSSVEERGELEGCTGKLFNLANPEAVDYMIDLIGGFIEKYNIDIYRQDFNIFPESFWEENDESGRDGITEIKYVEGEYRFLDALLERFPNLLIDCCASGGNRIDLETSMRCIFCWRSDTGCEPTSESRKRNLWSQNQNMRLSEYMVYHATASWIPKAYDVRSATSNGFSANFDVFDPDCDFENIRTILAECKRIRKYWEEDFYALSPTDIKEDHWCMCQYGSDESGVLMVFRREKDGREQQIIALRGLDSEKEYLLKISDENYQMTEVRVSGKELLGGYTFTLKEPRSSLAVEYLKQ